MNLFSKKMLLRLSLTALVLLIGIVAGLGQVRPPYADEASPDYAAYEGMITTIRALAAEPHISGSPEIARVRARLVAEIAAMGLTPTIQDDLYTKTEMLDYQLRLHGYASWEAWWEDIREVAAERYDIHSMEELIDYNWTELVRGRADGTLPLQNILVELDAPDTERGVLFVAHYDSWPGANGAGDGMVGVAAMLEAIRTQAGNDARKSDLYFLFTDGEEAGLLGAKAFTEARPDMKDKLDLVINLEARGVRGGVLLFETSPAPHALLQAVKRSGAKPIGFSWLAAVYAMMPNDTDLSVFLDEGYPGINFAMAEGVEHYHQPTDAYENLDPSSAWQYLRTTLALADYAARHGTDGLRQPSREAVYFPFTPGAMVLVGMGVSHIVCAAACAAALVFAGRARRRGQLKALPAVGLGLLAALSVLSAVYFAPGSYLFYVPLLTVSATGLLRDYPIARAVSRVVSALTTLLLWVPTVYLLWVLMIAPLG